MLRSTLIHPEISAVLARAGHHSKVLIADGNYPAANKMGPNATLISMNLCPGLISCSQALEVLLAALPLDAVNTMDYEREGQYALSSDPPVWDSYRKVIAESDQDLQLEAIEKWAFYEAVMTDDHVLTIQTGDQEPFANILLTIGCRTLGN
jgi:L-fucose mutarotase